MNRQRVRALLAGTTATVGLAALTLALPIALATLVGWPLPRAMPVLGDLRWRLTNGQIPDAFWIKLLACILWFAWAQLIAGVLTEVVAIVRRRPALQLPNGFGWAQQTASRLIAAAALIGSLAQSGHAFAATPLSALPQHTPTAIAASQPAFATSRPVSREDNGRTWEVARLDTLWGIAEHTLGDGNRWSEIRDANIGRVMDDGAVLGSGFTALRPGWILQLPVGATAQTKSSAIAIGERVVHPDDNFWYIAETTLADAWDRQPTADEIRPYWVSLVEYNRDRLASPRDPSLIFPGQSFEITLPPLPSEVTGAWDTSALTSLDQIHSVVRPVFTSPPPTADYEPVPPPPPISTTSTTRAPETTSIATTRLLTRSSPPTASPTVPVLSSTVRANGAPVVTIQAPVSERDDSRLVAVLAGCGVLAGGLVMSLRALRRAQLRRRHAYTHLPPLSDEASDAEQALRSIARIDATAWLDATMRYLAAQFTDDPRPPVVLAARAGGSGLELLLEEGAVPPRGFLATEATLRTWRVDASIELQQLDAEAGDANAHCPALCAIGTTGEDELLINLEALDVMAVEGEPDVATAFLRALALAASAMPWAQHVDVVAIGISDPPASAIAPADPDEWATTAINDARHRHDRLEAPPRVKRLRTGADAHYPTIVFVGPGHDHLAQQLSDAATLERGGLTLIAASDIAARYVLRINSGHATLEPLGIAIIPLQVGSPLVVAIDELWENAHETPAALCADAETNVMIALATTLESSAETKQEIIELTKLGQVDIRILCRTPEAVGLTGLPPGKLLAVIAFLAYHRRVTSERLRTTFWPIATQRTFANNMTLVRKLLGNREDGSPRLSDATNNHEYTLADDVTLDWHRSRHLIARAGKAAVADAIRLLEAALEQVFGWPFVDAPSEHYHWYLDDLNEHRVIETTLLDAAERLGELALQARNADLARWAVRQGQIVVPGQESLYRLRMRIEHQAGNRQGVIDAYQDAVHAVETIDDCDEVQPETQRLYRRLLADTSVRLRAG